MSLDPHHLRQHLELAAQAYGSDLPLIVPAASVAPPAQPPATPPQATARTEAIAMPVVPPAPAPAPARPASPVAPAPAPPTAAPAMTTAATAGDRVAQLQALKAEVLPCTRCKLHQGRIQTVFGEGNPHTRVLFVGEAPGAVEDQTGRPFVGPAGQLLDRILAGAMGLDRKDVFIANINKCRPDRKSVV